MSSLLDVYQNYLAAVAGFSRFQAPTGATAATGPAYAQFGLDENRQLMGFVDTGDIHCKTSELLKIFNSIEFKGHGTLYVIAWVDNTMVAQGWCELSMDANQTNIFALPQGTAGYSIRLQIAGVADWKFFDIDFEFASSDHVPESHGQQVAE